jgi:hypothetical protein
MTPICECALLHADHRSVLRICQECGSACCRSCALEIESQAYCRWCAMSVMPALSA